MPRGPGRTVVDNKIVQKIDVWKVMNGGQGEIYLHPDPIDLEIADFRFEFARWIKNNTRSPKNPVNHNSVGEVAL